MAQKGVILITCLLFLLILTLIGVVAFNMTSLTEKMSNNFKDNATAFQAASSALTEGEVWLKAQVQKPVSVTTCTNPPCAVLKSATPLSLYLKPSSWWISQGRPLTVPLPLSAAPAYFVIEELSFVPNELSPDALSLGKGYYSYRITSHGVGNTPNANVTIESIYGVQYN